MTSPPKTSLQDAVTSLYQIAIVDARPTASNRLDVLAMMCIEQLDDRGITGATTERPVPGIGRDKRWDVVWPAEGKARLGISLKSLLKNIPGTVPNRVDDLVGEMANVQLRSPEIVTGYVVMFNGANGKRSDGTRWVDFFRGAVDRLSGRRRTCLGGRDDGSLRRSGGRLHQRASHHAQAEPERVLRPPCHVRERQKPRHVLGRGPNDSLSGTGLGPQADLPSFVSSSGVEFRYPCHRLAQIRVIHR